MSRKKIMLVDDSSTALLMERAILSRRRDFDLVTARDGEEAVALSVVEKPDLILMDVMMPKMNGFEACRRIRNDPKTKDIPIIMVTTRGEMDNMETGYASGCSDYVTKPINGLELLTKLEDLLGGAEALR